MGIKYICDLCSKEVPLESALTTITFGEAKVVDACYTCQSTLKSAIAATAAEATKLIGKVSDIPVPATHLAPQTQISVPEIQPQPVPGLPTEPKLSVDKNDKEAKAGN